MVTTSATYRFIARDLERSLTLTSKQRPVALETDYFLKNINDIKSIDDLLGDTRLFNYAMKAFGLEDLAYAKGLIRKILSEGVDDPQSIANRIDDDRFVQFATVFNFKRDGELATAKTAARQGVVDRYVRQALELASGADNEGVRLALYFQRQAPNVKSYFAILADPALSKVVKTAFGLPDAMATADIDRQAAALSERFDLADLKDPAKLDRLLTRFAAAWDAADTAHPEPVLSLFESGSAPTLDLNLIVTLQNLKHGGS